MPKYRPYVMPSDAQRLDQLAAPQVIDDAEAAHCWELVRVGIQTLKIGTEHLGELLDHLRAGNGMTLDELTVEVEPPGSDRMLVGILDDQRTCSAPKMIAELELLARRAREAPPSRTAEEAVVATAVKAIAARYARRRRRRTSARPTSAIGSPPDAPPDEQA